MKRKKWNLKGETGWLFAIVNGRLGEIYFQDAKWVRNIFAHCYIDRKEFTKKEREMINKDITRYRFSYRNGKYRRMHIINDELVILQT